MEVAMKLMEKDIHEKQDTIISLRRQLDDIKLINLEMYKKLQVGECLTYRRTNQCTLDFFRYIPISLEFLEWS